MSDPEQQLSPHGAYLAMYDFPRRYDDRSPNVPLFLLLHSVEIGSDSQSADPGTWPEWLQSVERVESGSVDRTDHPDPPDS
jgi:hypothetical protein